MAGILRNLVSDRPWVWLFGAGAAVLAWGVATILLTLATLVAYAMLRLPVLLTLHDEAASLAAGLVAVGAAAFAARGLVGEG